MNKILESWSPEPVGLVGGPTGSMKCIKKSADSRETLLADPRNEYHKPTELF